MEKKTKLTISGNVKKKIEKFNYSSSKKNSSIILDRPVNNDKNKINTRPPKRMEPNTGFKKSNVRQNKKNCCEHATSPTSAGEGVAREATCRLEGPRPYSGSTFFTTFDK